MYDPKAVVNLAHQRMVKLAFSYYEQTGEAPKPDFLMTLLRKDLRENVKDTEKHLWQLTEASATLDYTDIASTQYWIEEMYRRQREWKIKNAYGEYANDQDAAKLFEAIRAAEKITPGGDELWNYATATYQPRRHYLKGFVGQKDLVLLYGPSGSYKSFVALEWCLSIATGRQWQGRKVKKERVLYVCAESGENLKKRIDAWAMANEVSAEEIAENFRALTHETKLDDPTEYPQIVKHIENWEAKVVCFDTVDRCMVGSESSTEDMKKFVDAAVRLIREMEVAVILVHHTGKDVARGSKGDNRLPNACDVVVQCLKAEAMSTTTRLTTEKMKEDAKSEPVYLRSVRHTLGYCDEDGDEETSLSLESCTQAEYSTTPVASLSVDELTLMNHLPGLSAEGLTDELVASGAVSQARLGELCGLEKSKLSRMVISLVAAGHIAKRQIGKTNYVWLPTLS